MTEFTAGPWTYDYTDTSSGETEFMVMAADNAVVAHVWPDNERGVSGGIVEANARLISSATELLQSCRELRAVLHHDCGATEEVHLFEHVAPASLRASAAIAKAEGQKP